MVEDGKWLDVLEMVKFGAALTNFDAEYALKKLYETKDETKVDQRILNEVARFCSQYF